MALVLDEVSIINMIIDHMTDYLSQIMRTDTTDATKAGLVRAGKLQDDPTLKKVNILIHPGGSAWPDILNKVNDGPDMSGPTYSFGGGAQAAVWRRRFKVEMQIFYPNENSRISTRTKALTILSRLHYAIHVMPMTLGPDSFGETAYQAQVIEMFLREGGGEGDFNWRGELVVEVMTEIEPTLAGVE